MREVTDAIVGTISGNDEKFYTKTREYGCNVIKFCVFRKGEYKAVVKVLTEDEIYNIKYPFAEEEIKKYDKK